MVNKMELQKHWQQVKGKLKEKFPQLSESDLNLVEGKEEQLFSKIQDRTGKPRRVIEQEIESLLFSSSAR